MSAIKLNCTSQLDRFWPQAAGRDGRHIAAVRCTPTLPLTAFGSNCEPRLPATSGRPLTDPFGHQDGLQHEFCERVLSLISRPMRRRLIWSESARSGNDKPRRSGVYLVACNKSYAALNCFRRRNPMPARPRLKSAKVAGVGTRPPSSKTARIAKSSPLGKRLE